MFRHLSTACLYLFLGLINLIWATGSIPDSWKHSVIVSILKPGKDPSVPGYRPIALTSNLCKLMERMVNARMIWFLERNKLLHKLQSGFRRNRNTVDHLVLLSNDIYHSLSNRRSTLGVFIDFEKAYDLIWKEGSTAR